MRVNRSWLIVASLFVALFVVFGAGINTAGVFFAPMLEHFSWSSTKLSSLQTALALSAGLAAPAVGWLLDRYEARVIMSGGIALAGAGFVLASRANGFEMMTAAYLMLGVGVCGSTLLPCSLVVARWFDQNRGTALGIVTSGTSIGGMVMTLVAQRAIDAAGWRTGLIVLAAPMFLVALPLVLFGVSSYPPDAKVNEEKKVMFSGLDLGRALRSRGFWLIAAAQLLYSFASIGATVHTVPYLVRMGFTAEHAAEVFSLTLGLASLGKLLTGYAADYLTGRLALALSLAAMAVGQAFLLGARRDLLLAAYTLVYGMMSGAPLALIPMVIADSLGLKRFGSLAGLTGIFVTLGAATGPLAAGWMVDRGAGYPAAFILFTVTLGIGGLAAAACAPLVGGEHVNGMASCEHA
jgi:sugar phosphate permease